MAALRCTARLLKRLKEAPIASPPQPENRLGDWYANILNVGRHRLVLATSDRTLLTVVVPIKDSRRLRERLREATHRLLFALAVPPDLAAQEVKGMDRMPFAQTADRSVISSMNEMVFQAQAFFDPGQPTFSADDLLIYLNDTPCGPIQYSTPIRATREAFGLPAKGGPRWSERAAPYMRSSESGRHRF